jgi:hypothetical protein
MARRLLATQGTYGGQTRVYRTADGLEIDSAEDDKILRRRLFWDEVLLVTLHRASDWPFLVTAGLGTLFLMLMTFAFAAIEGRVGVAWSLLTWIPLGTYAVLRAIKGVPTVSVYGRRTCARLPFPLRAERARQTYAEMCSAARRRQEAMRVAAARRAAATAPAAPPPIG